MQNKCKVFLLVLLVAGCACLGLAWKAANTSLGTVVGDGRYRVFTPFDCEGASSMFIYLGEVYGSQESSAMGLSLRARAQKYRQLTYLYAFIALLCLAVAALLVFPPTRGWIAALFQPPKPAEMLPNSCHLCGVSLKYDMGATKCHRCGTYLPPQS